MKNLPLLRQKVPWRVPCHRLWSTALVVGLLFFTTNSWAQNGCLLQADIQVVATSLGSPPSGPFLPDEEITLALIIVWEAQSCNWLHGLIPTFGNGWSSTSFGSSGEPLFVDIPLNKGPGQFLWYDDQEVHYNFINSQEYAPGQTMPPGWFTTGTSGNPTIPNGCGPNDFHYLADCSCGIAQTCNSQTVLDTHIKVKTNSLEACQSGLNDLSVSFKIFSDYETGSGFQSNCFDIAPVQKTFALDCTLLGPEILGSAIATSNNDVLDINLTEYLMDPNEEDVTFQWSVESPAEVSGASACQSNCGTNILQLLTNHSDQAQEVIYTVVARNNLGQVGIPQEFKVTVWPTLLVTLDPPAPICEEECVTLEATVTGGSGNYNFEWETANSTTYEVCPESTRSYTLIVTDDLGEMVSRTVEVVVQANPVANLLPLKSIILCSGMTPPYLTFETDVLDYSISWSGPGITTDNMTADSIWTDVSGIYQLELTDLTTGCTKAFQKEVLEFTPPEILLSATETVVCRGDIPLNILSAEPAGGVWSGSVTAQGEFIPTGFGVQELTYSYEEPISGCVTSEVIEIEVVEANVAFLDITTEPVDQYCSGLTYEFCATAMDEAKSFTWEAINGTIASLNAAGNCATFIWEADQPTGGFCLSYDNLAGCSSEPICPEFALVHGTACDAVSTTEISRADFSIIPNPVQDRILIQSEQLFEEVIIFDALGQPVFNRKNINARTLELSQLNLAAGIYFITIDNGRLERFVQL